MLLSIAAENVEARWLERWWRKKYNRPSKDQLLSSYTYEELYVEYLEDLVEEFGEDGVALNTGTKDNPIFKTKDPVASGWEQALARGESVNFLDAVAEEDRSVVERFMRRKQTKAPAAGEFDDNYKAGDG